MSRRARGWVLGTLLMLPLGCIGAAPLTSRETVHVMHVVDGDTIDVRWPDGRRERVRLIGVDTPELHESAKLDREAGGSATRRAAIQALGRRADAYTRRALADRDVALSFDAQTRDRWRRLLAYVWLPDGTLFNRQLVCDGMADLMTIPPNVAHADAFRACVREARAARRGFWGDPTSGWQP